MNAHTTELRESAVELEKGKIRVRAGFRIGSGELLAGGPVEMEFFVESYGLHPLQLAVAGDRMRQRPGQFRFTATFEGSLLADPMADVPYMGGPEGVVKVSSDAPWHQPLVLNQFVQLEHTRERLTNGSKGRMNLECRRPFCLTDTTAAALSHDGAQELVVNLAFDLRRDDDALETLIARLFENVMQGPPESREWPLVLLLSMRTAAKTHIRALARHPDPYVAERARQTVAMSM
ncbi:MAG TPA: hypothetical protein VF172_03395 [Nitrososphaera sp.]|jgi:hypothetical protein